MDQESIGIALVYVCVCEEDTGRLDCRFVLLHSTFYILYSIFYILYSIFKFASIDSSQMDGIKRTVESIFTRQKPDLLPSSTVIPCSSCSSVPLELPTPLSLSKRLLPKLCPLKSQSHYCTCILPQLLFVHRGTVAKHRSLPIHLHRHRNQTHIRSGSCLVPCKSQCPVSLTWDRDSSCGYLA